MFLVEKRIEINIEWIMWISKPFNQFNNIPCTSVGAYFWHAHQACLNPDIVFPIYHAYLPTWRYIYIQKYCFGRKIKLSIYACCCANINCIHAWLCIAMYVICELIGWKVYFTEMQWTSQSMSCCDTLHCAFCFSSHGHHSVSKFIERHANLQV